MTLALVNDIRFIYRHKGGLLGEACYDRKAEAEKEKVLFPPMKTLPQLCLESGQLMLSLQQGPGSLGLFPHMDQESVQMCEQITTVDR